MAGTKVDAATVCRSRRDGSRRARFGDGALGGALEHSSLPHHRRRQSQLCRRVRRRLSSRRRPGTRVRSQLGQVLHHLQHAHGAQTPPQLFVPRSPATSTADAALEATPSASVGASPIALATSGDKPLRPGAAMRPYGAFAGARHERCGGCCPTWRLHNYRR